MTGMEDVLISELQTNVFKLLVLLRVFRFTPLTTKQSFVLRVPRQSQHLTELLPVHQTTYRSAQENLVKIGVLDKEYVWKACVSCFLVQRLLIAAHLVLWIMSIDALHAPVPYILLPIDSLVWLVELLYLTV